MAEIMLRAAIAIVALAEAASLLVGAALHLGVSLPVPLAESTSLPSAVLEAGAGALLLYSVWGVVLRHGRAWQVAVAAHVLGVAAIVFAIGAGASRGARLAGQASHHSRTLLVLILVLLVLALPACRRALGGTRRPSRRHRRGRRRSNRATRL